MNRHSNSLRAKRKRAKRDIQEWASKEPRALGLPSALKKKEDTGATERSRRPPSYLTEESKTMERNQRILEQEGLRKLGIKVLAREHNLDTPPSGPEGELQNSIQQHPLLDNQRFDGIDANVNPLPPLNSEARREFDNQRREQEMEKQLRLGNMPTFSTAPKPQKG